MSRRIREHIRGNVVGYVALFLVVTGGTAQALNGSNTVFSDDIVNREVKNQDLALGAVSTNRLAPKAVKGGRVADDTLTGTQILESALGQVPDAAHASSADNVASGAITTSKFGPITRRVASITIAGGTGENGSYNTGTKSVSCQSGEMAINGEAYWAGQPNEELFISEFIYAHNQDDRPVGLRVTGGNDSGVNRLMNVAVYCLAP
jgi:hypothetical protein